MKSTRTMISFIAFISTLVMCYFYIDGGYEIIAMREAINVGIDIGLSQENVGSFASLIMSLPIMMCIVLGVLTGISSSKDRK